MINLVNYEQGKFDGILSKFAYRMKDTLIELGYDAKVSPVPDPNADINHHINYLPYNHKNSPKTINTLMVTHIFEGYKKDALKEQIKTAYGICMSDDTRKQLISWGFPKNKLSTILPAHDGKPRRMQVVAILTNVYPDGCKRAEMFTELCKVIDKKKFAFRIMGKDWADILTSLVAEGLQVDYFNEFDADYHQKILESSDYYLYFGVDDGSMGALDAKNAGLKLIVPPVGYHQDLNPEYPFNSQKELNEIFEKLAINPVEDWTWKKYVEQHIKIWQKLKK